MKAYKHPKSTYKPVLKEKELPRVKIEDIVEKIIINGETFYI